MSTVRGCSSRTTSSSGNAARASASRVAADVTTSLCPGAAADDHEQTVETELALCGARELDVPTVRRVERAAVEAERRRHASSSSSSPTSTVAPRFAPAARNARSSSSGGGGEPSTRNPRSVRSRRHGRCLGLRTVDEVVDEPVVGGSLDWLRLRDEREEGAAELVDPFTGRARDAEDGDDARVLDRELRVRLEVDLVQDDDLRSFVEAGSVGGELGVDRPPLLVGRLRAVDHVHERACTLEVGEELVAEADTLARSLDQPGDVGDDELAPVGRLDRAEHGLQRRERVVGDLRPRVREAGDERRLARVRQADERCVGEQLQMELDVALLAGQPDLGEARHLPCRRDEARVAAAAAGRRARARRARRTCARSATISPSSEHLRPDRHVQLDVVAVGAVLAGAAPVAAASRLDQAAPLQRRQVAQRRVGNERRRRRRVRRRRRRGRPSARTSRGGS